jgi:general secretion pathway protein G
MLTAMQRSRQKRTMADMRTIATASEAYATDKNVYPPAASVAELPSTLVPTYAKGIATVDGWGTPLRYECWPAGECTSYAIGSAGADKVFEHESLQEYASGTKTTHFNNDIVFVNGVFVQYPDGIQSGGQ